MFRSRLLNVVVLLAGMAAVMYLLVSLFLPSSRRLIFGVDKATGEVRLVRSNITFLPPHRFYRLAFDKREGSAQRDGVIRIVSKDGVPVTVAYRLRFSVAGERIRDARRLVSDGWSAWIRARVSEAVSAVTSQIPIEELLSPTSSFNTKRDPLRQTVARHLAESGLNVTAFEIARFEVDHDALLRAKRVELRRDARSVPYRVAIFALDGADWELLSELADDDRIPNLKALAHGGTSGSIQTIQPTVSPLLWTTVATGVTPDRHGVLDFSNHGAPADSYARRSPGLWDIADAFGRSTMVVNWWTAWPPTARTSVAFDAPVQLLPSAVYPPQLQPRIAPLIITPENVGYDQTRRFLNIAATEFDKSVQNGPGDPVNIFRNVLAKTWTDHRVAINLYHEQKPMLTMVSYEGTDAVNHLFAPFHPPYREGVSEEAYRRYWPAVANYYAEIDRLIGEWMNELTPDTTVIILSAHGFRWGKTRPHQPPNGGAALSDHRNPGIFIMYGPHVAPSRAAHPMTLYDVAPTVLALLGLPPSAEMPGHAATWAFKDITPIQSVRVISYGEFVADRPATGPRTDPKAYQQALQAIGHLNDPSRSMTPVLEDEEQPAETNAPLPPQQWGAYAYYNNIGIQLRSQGKWKESIEAFQKAVELNPNRPVPYVNLAMTVFDRQQYSNADEDFLAAVSKGLPNAEQWFVDFAALYRQRNMASRAIALLYKGKQLFPQSYLIAANLGSALMDSERYTEGLPELERALGLQPSSTAVLDNLGVFYAKKNDYGRALDYWNRSLSNEPRQPQIREAVNAARTRL